MKAQVFITDFLIGLFVFTIIFVVGMHWWSVSSNDFQEALITTTIEQKADSLLTLFISTQGYPYNWDANSDIEQFGFAIDPYDLEGYKVENFYEYVSDNYGASKTIMGLEEYEFNLKIINFDSEVLYDVGNYPGTISNVVKIKKFAFLDDDPVRIEMLVWK